MANFCIITNNPMAASKYPELAKYQERSVGDVYTAARDMVHRGSVLIGHPLAGSVKPNENPYRSVVLSTEKGWLDFNSLQLIEDAISVLHRLPVKNLAYPASVLEDFQVIDLDLLDSAITALPAEYHA